MGRGRGPWVRPEDGGRRTEDGYEKEIIMGERISSFRDLRVYQKAFQLQQDIFEITKQFPPEEKYSLTDQIRRSSRSICANIAESWQK